MTTTMESNAPDHVLLTGALAGSRESFDLLYERHFPKVYNFVARRVREVSEAEDVVQEIFVQALSHLAAYRAEGTFLAWLYGITRNVLRRHYLKQRRARREVGHHRIDVTETPDVVEDAVTPERRASARELGQRAVVALEALDPENREVYLLHHLEGISIRDLSARTHRSEDAIKSDLYRIRRKISKNE